MNFFQKIQNKEKWKRLLDKVLFKTFFHSPEWEEFLEKNFRWLKFEHYIYKDELLLSAARYRALGKERMISHPFCEYGGPLPLKKSIDGRAFRKELATFFDIPFKISLHPEIPSFFKDFGLKEPDSERDSYFIEYINDRRKEMIFSSFRKTLRHSIRKAEEQSLEFRRCREKEELRDFYNLYLKAAQRHRTIPYPFSFFEYFMNHTLSNVGGGEGAEIAVAGHKGRIIAGSVFLYYGKYVHYFINASDERFKDLGANYGILWHKVKENLRGERQIFDLGGTRRDSALEVFKKGWGTKRHPIFELKSGAAGKSAKSKMRNFISIIPPKVLEKLSPCLLKYKL